MTDYTLCTATELADLYCAGSASPVSVAEQVLAKIERVDPALNAFCFTDPKTTLAQAEASAQRWRQGQPWSNLDGVPIAVKDLLLVSGWPTRYGSCAIDPDQDWSEDSLVAAQLRKKGAVFVGKTTTSEFGCQFTTDSILHGITRNPWNIKYSSGGSSGGSASAVAASMVPIAIGTDHSGSIRTPSSFCGTIGFKPSYGAIPHNDTSAFECICVGPIARSVDDIALFLNTTIKSLDMSKIRVAYWPDLGFAKNINHEILGAVDQVALALTQAGAQVSRINKVIDDPINIIGPMMFSDIYQRWAQLTDHQRKLIGPEYQYLADQASKATHSILQIKVQQLQLKKQMQEFMSLYDVILSPSTAFSADDFLADDITFDASEIISESIPFGYPFNVTHQPAITVPVKLNSNNMPIGIQLAGAVGADDLVLSLAQVVKSAFPMPACPVIL
jgi:Asp-tRNA(Asn)/Glu-tRNA(Gln) amidotransferase A subunit family amidase